MASGTAAYLGRIQSGERKPTRPTVVHQQELQVERGAHSCSSPNIRRKVASLNRSLLFWTIVAQPRLSVKRPDGRSFLPPNRAAIHRFTSNLSLTAATLSAVRNLVCFHLETWCWHPRSSSSNTEVTYGVLAGKSPRQPPKSLTRHPAYDCCPPPLRQINRIAALAIRERSQFSSFLRLAVFIFPIIPSCSISSILSSLSWIHDSSVSISLQMILDSFSQHALFSAVHVAIIYWLSIYRRCMGP